MASLGECLASARLAWESNYTRGVERWGLKQLHRLYHLILDIRDELISTSTLEHSGSRVTYESEIAFLVQEIHSHIENQTRLTSSAALRSLHLGELQETFQPCGVNVIICGKGTQMGIVIGTLAASIAAGNVTILAMVADRSDPLVTCLSRAWSKYLDQRSIFLSAGFKDGSLGADDASSIFIYDTAPDSYPVTLSFPNARFHSTSKGLNLVIITDAGKAWKTVADEIRAVSGNDIQPQDRLDAVFVLEQDAGLARQSLTISEVYDTTTKVSSVAKFESSLQTSRTSGSPLLVVVTSIDRIIDLLASIATPVQQLAFLGSNAAKQAKYVRPWVDVDLVAVRFIYPIALLARQGQALPGSVSTAFPSSHFSRCVLLARRPPQKAPLTTAALRKYYEGLIAPLKPEPRGERVGFFDQVGYLAKGVGAVGALAGLTGLYFGARWIQRRL